MIFNINFANLNFVKISMDNFIEKHKTSNPQTDITKLRKDLLHFRQLKINDVECNCGNPIWIIGSAISGKGCFTCITGDSDSSKDVEIE